MATLNLDVKEFENLVLIFLFDSVMNPENSRSEGFKKFIDKHSSKIKTPLMKAYLDSSSEDRIRYKRIKGVFDGTDKGVQQIRIGPSEQIDKLKKSKKGIVSKLIKKIIAKEQLTIEDEQMLREIIENDNLF